MLSLQNKNENIANFILAMPFKIQQTYKDMNFSGADFPSIAP